jgi:hypothetical protein
MPKTILTIFCDVCGKPHQKTLAHINQNKKLGRSNCCSRSCMNKMNIISGINQRRLISERFFEKVEKTSNCWNWMGALSSKGYGYFWLENKMELAHRISWILIHGYIPEGFEVMHECDNPKCVNPDHLFLGTHAQNMADMKNKNRAGRNWRKGSQCAHAKLDEEQVKKIIHEIKLGRAHINLAHEFGVSRTAITAIATGRNWKHIRDANDQQD